jgi:clan AA aspartic protease
MDRITGQVDRATLSPIVPLTLFSGKNERSTIQTIVDTGYNGELILPENNIQELDLEFVGTIDGELANGEIVEMKLFKGRLQWFGSIEEVAIGSTESESPLLGTQLLADCELHVNFKEGVVEISKTP